MNVEWHEVALDRLADIYVAALPHERDPLAECVAQMNARLALDPSNLGESRSARRRVWFNPPLMTVYDLIPGGGVLVVHVARIRNSPASE